MRFSDLRDTLGVRCPDLLWLELSINSLACQMAIYLSFCTAGEQYMRFVDPGKLGETERSHICSKASSKMQILGP